MQMYYTVLKEDAEKFIEDSHKAMQKCNKWYNISVVKQTDKTITYRIG